MATSNWEKAFSYNPKQNEQPESPNLVKSIESNDKWEKAFSTQPEQQTTIPKAEDTQQNVDFEEDHPVNQKLKDYVKEFSRHIARTTVRGAEGVSESLRGLEELPEAAFGYAYKKFTGNEFKPEEHGGPSGGWKKAFPSKSEIEEKLPEKAREYLKPQTKGEESWDKVVEMAAPFTIPFGGEYNFLRRVATGALASTAGKAAKETTEALGGTKNQGELANNITMFLTSAVNPGGASREASRLYNEARRSIPRDITGDAGRLETMTRQTQRNVSGGGLAPSEQEIATASQNILNDIHNGQMSYQQALDHLRSLNENSARTLYAPAPKATKIRARSLYNELHGELSRFLDTSEKLHPEFWQNQRNAREAFGTISQSRQATEWIKQNSGELAKYGVPTATIAFMTKGLPSAATIGTAGTAGLGLLKTGEFLYRIGRSPVLRRYYTASLAAAARNDLPAFAKNIKKFSEESKDDPEILSLIEGRSKDKDNKGKGDEEFIEVPLRATKSS